MHKTVRKVLGVGAVAGLFVAACGGDSSSGGGNGGGAFTSGVPSDQPISSLGDGDVQKFCAAIQHYLESDAELKTAQCHFGGVSAAIFMALFNASATDADLQKACTDTENGCMHASSTSSGTCSKPTGTCTATVGELEACMTDSFAEVESTINEFPPCATLKRADVSPSTGGSSG
ncbi:MAG TPA: hypothetical protein VHE30_11690, partial [Polyangiaceae bacterium]|nr:hypothetical protein [Polyangiaceae bacterium]